ncbi:MAG: hypothetical protein QOJ13_3432 [Gaiellales bacterium]|jgi:hypothetical protein|nr:hypothetical protein [Gaiellales bacterium]MDX6594236.1 hypothetical protein [Gaiellales bacterium]
MTEPQTDAEETERRIQDAQTRRFSRALWITCGAFMTLKLTMLAVIVSVT